MSLPKYGSLSSVLPLGQQYNSPHYTDWTESFQVSGSNGSPLVTAPGAGRKLGICYGVDTTGTNGVRSGTNGYRYCSENFGVFPSLSDHVLGNTPEVMYLRSERVVSYVPNFKYQGPDFFTYIIYDGLNVQNHINEYGTGSENQVTVHVRDCRPVDYQDQFNISSTVHPLCTCASSETSLIGDIENCAIARNNVCGVTNVTTTTSTTSYSTSSGINGKEEHFYNLCVACPSDLTLNNLSSESVDKLSGARSECVSQIIRAVNLLNSNNLCTYKPHMDCTAESITLPGKEKINFLSLKASPGSGSFSMLGNNFGGVGWFGSAASGTP